jgi:undecaprenyl diphosphate synthase
MRSWPRQENAQPVIETAVDSRCNWTVPDVDLLIRTGGEKLLSDFLLWECA